MEKRRNTTYGGRPSMPLEDRAKIFSPFDPLQGFREALRQKEREVEAAVKEGKSVAHGTPASSCGQSPTKR